jgi:hypothetical protein
MLLISQLTCIQQVNWLGNGYAKAVKTFQPMPTFGICVFINRLCCRLFYARLEQAIIS